MNDLFEMIGYDQPEELKRLVSLHMEPLSESSVFKDFEAGTEAKHFAVISDYPEPCLGYNGQAPYFSFASPCGHCLTIMSAVFCHIAEDYVDSVKEMRKRFPDADLFTTARVRSTPIIEAPTARLGVVVLELDGAPENTQSDSFYRLCRAFIEGVNRRLKTDIEAYQEMWKTIEPSPHGLDVKEITE